MPNKKPIIIEDPELGQLDITDEKAVNDAIAEVPTDTDTKTPNPKDSSDEDFDEYKKAWEAVDVERLEALREKHPEDARFNLHLQFMPEEERQKFTEVQGLHKAINEKMGLAEVSQFNKLLEAGNKQKAEEFVDDLDDKHPLKKAMKTLIGYM